MTNTSNNNEPVARLKDRSLSIAVWRNTTEQGKVFYSVSKIKRTYKENGNYKETDTLSGTQLLQAARLLKQAYSHIRELEQLDYQSHPLDEDQAD